MVRSRATARKAGSSFERLIADALAFHIDDRIDRRPKMGSNDRGDIGGIRFHGERIVIEAKDYGGVFKIGPWLTEAEIERGNDDALAGMVVAKRRGKAAALDQAVIMTLRDLVAMMTLERPDEH